jgi:8-amino-7-oxononanoate synthase
MQSLEHFARDKLVALDAQSIRRRLIETDRDGPVTVQREGRRLISFCCNDYLNLTHHPDVKRAAIDAVERYGAGAAGSRLVTGSHPLYRRLEERLSAHKQSEDTIVFGSGYLANISIVPALAGRDDLVLIDELAHACLVAGASMTGGRRIFFRHNDVEHLAALLEEYRDAHTRCLILTDHVFSMDGDLAPLDAISALARRHDAWLVADCAHSTGVLPSPSAAEVPLRMGTLSKALGSYGGFLCAAAPVVDLLRSRARAFVYTTGLPPASVAAAIAALDVIEADPQRAGSPLVKAKTFCAALGLPEPASQIVPVIIGGAEEALAASQRIMDAGFLTAAIRPPTVPAGTARLRFTFTAAHKDEQIASLAAAVGEAAGAVLP